MVTIKQDVTSIKCCDEGFEKLARLFSATKEAWLDEIVLDFSKCAWFDANMSSPMSVILCRLKESNEVVICNFGEKTELILRKNRFLTHYGYLPAHDTFGTTIPFQNFAIHQSIPFFEYLKAHLRGKDMPKMSAGLDRRFKEGILEIFANAADHSETAHGIDACGQYFPQRHVLEFCIADAGIGIRRKLQRELGIKMRSDEAIEWALSGGNTTRKGPVPGGLGLKLLKDFITMNGGRLQIVSDRGYWEMHAGKVSSSRMAASFPGTAVNITINTADTKSYKLVSEKG